ncbi:MAG: phosphoribosyltransferase family protein [Phycisphaerae bacterium]|nr:phosphoribosyltransferase family protein [Phycisphaerae bacterium]
MPAMFNNRPHAGRELAAALRRYAGRADVLVLGLPRGGVEVAAEVADALHVPLDVMLVRKLGVPGHEELAMGAVGAGGARVLNRDVIAALGIPLDVVESVAEREGIELARRNAAYRANRPPPRIAGRTIILIDDGLATGASMRVAVQAVRQLQPQRVIVAVPVAPPETVRELGSQVDEMVCLSAPADFDGVGRWYADFSQTSDRQVRDLLESAWAREKAGVRQ